jgi:hypothetical protein
MSAADDAAQTLPPMLEMPPDVAAASVEKPLGPREFLDRR